jgi:hypothetical protein
MQDCEVVIGHILVTRTAVGLIIMTMRMMMMMMMMMIGLCAPDCINGPVAVFVCVGEELLWMSGD